MGDVSTQPRGRAIALTKLRSASTWGELEALPGFRTEQVAADVMRRGAVVGQYSMNGGDLRPCGIASCSQPHKHGFIVELPDGTLSHVGKICGKNKLGVAFNQMLVRFRKTRKAAAKAQAASKVRDEARDTIAEALVMPSGLPATKALLDTLNSLTPGMRASLERRAATNDSQIVRMRDPTREEVNRAKFMHDRIPTTVSETIASIDEIKAVAPNSRADVVAEQRIPRLAAELSAMVADLSVDADSIASKIRTLRDARNLLDRSIERAARFFVPGNVAKLGFLEDVNAPRRVTFDAGPPPKLSVDPADPVAPHGHNRH